MNNTKLLLLLFIIIKQSISQDIRSLSLSEMVDTKYQCNSTGCSLSSIVSASSLSDCQFTCLSNTQCQTITFDQSSQQCDISSDHPSQYGQLLRQTGVITLIVIDGSQLFASATTSTTTSTTSSTTTISDPCASGQLRWNTTGITVLGSSLGIATSGLYVDSNDTLYAVDENIGHVVWKLLKNAVNATIIAGIYGSDGSNNNQLYFPNDVYVDRNGNLYVNDCYNSRIQKFINGSNIGTTIAGINGVAGSSLNQLDTARYLTFDAADTYMYIADASNNRIMRYSTNSTAGTNGDLVAGGTGAGNTNTSLNYPWGIHYLPSVSNDLFITNHDGHSVMRWTPGALSGVFVAGAPGISGSSSMLLNNPKGIKIDHNSNMYVVDGGNHRVQMFCAGNQTGITIAGTGSAGSGSTDLNEPRGIAFDSAMNMYISDTFNRRIQKFLKL